ncbi:hypothetical protein LF599_04590 [Pseudodesulfovibrio thermohalotolerans]|uniref:hypothetical protein n=1 Tax=Pseudodesulfovibrio thermohalotolerans TaxID=2880651 RepID=UPI00244246B5|nr:hypothetical protein [Pseudodesulfovibrio thermohalotolerans]WFS63446.1 hypothetical protein LF599_04590 [Pseudodesulfovibrio thermohalotolerans]
MVFFIRLYLVRGCVATPVLESPSLKLKANLRSQALHCAVQVVKMQEVDDVETEVDRLYEKYCVKFAAKPEKREEDPDCPDLVHRFLDEAMVFTDVSLHGTHPRHLKTQMKDVYKLFRDFCREQDMKEYEIPSMRWLGGCFKHRKDVIRVSPRDRVFYNIVPRYE